MNSPTRHGIEDRNLDRLRRLHHELARLTDKLRNLPPRHRAQAALLIAANEAVLLLNARCLTATEARAPADLPRRTVVPVTNGHRSVRHHKVISH